MESVIQHFRTALSGFNRQDVQNYIEQLSAAHRQELEELQKRLDKEEDRAARMEGELSRLRAVEEEAVRIKADLDGSTKLAARLKGELSQSESKLSVAKKELERLQAQVAALSPLAAGYQELRDRAASVELEAHQRAQGAEQEARRRAQETVSAAREEADRLRSEAQEEAERVRSESQREAERVRSEAQSWLVRVLEQYDQLREDLDGLVEQARAVSGSAGRLELLDESARRLREQGGLK